MSLPLVMCLALLSACPVAVSPDPSPAVEPDGEDAGSMTDAGTSSFVDAGEPEDERDAGNLPDDAGTEPPLPADAGPQVENTAALCTDQIDNDHDTYTDCRDFDCADVPVCNVPENTEAACTDGLDNDSDSYIDCRDFDCDLIPVCMLPEDHSASCSDGFDNDGDGFKDCLDTECQGLIICDPDENSTATCTDLRDNDDDGDTDCDDAECAVLPVCQTTEDAPGTCSDGVDNDGNNFKDCQDAKCAAFEVCTRQNIRLLTYNVKSVSDTGPVEREALASVLARIDSDVACLQEIRPNDDEEEADLEDIAASLGFTNLYWGWTTPLGGALRNVCLSKFPIDYSSSASLSSSDLSSDGLANETGRDIVQVRIQVQPGVFSLGVFTVHLKSGFAAADRFRRHIEAERLGQAIALYKMSHPNDGIVVTGDFNEELGDEWVGSWTTQPDITASSYRLGTDQSFPIVYAPFAPVLEQNLLEVVATAEDDEVDFATRISGRHIDYIFVSGVNTLGSEVYRSDHDNGVDDLPIGNFMEKSGAPLAAEVSDLSSDHYPVVVDLTF